MIPVYLLCFRARIRENFSTCIRSVTINCLSYLLTSDFSCNSYIMFMQLYFYRPLMSVEVKQIEHDCCGAVL